MSKHDAYYLEIAKTVATRATCPKKQVGCVLVNTHGHIVATGFNGVPRGFPHCTDEFCGDCPCLATHAEANAFLQCSDVLAVRTVYCTLEPCINCSKLIANSGAKRVVFLHKYKGDGTELLMRLGLDVLHYAGS